MSENNTQEQQAPKPKIKLTFWGNDILAKPTELVSKEYLESPEFKEVKRRMFELTDEDGSAGLAANQIGVAKRFALVRVKENPNRIGSDVVAIPPTLIINPEILDRSKDMRYRYEGCFSNRGIFFYIPRHQWIELKYLDEQGKSVTRKIEGFESVVYQHEIDHLDGYVCGERVLVVDGKVAKGAIITQDEYRKDLKRVPPGFQVPQ